MPMLWYNIPALSIFLVLGAGMVIPLLRRARHAQWLCLAVQTATAVLSGLLLLFLWGRGDFFTYQMGHFPAPWGNMLRCGPLEAMLALTFSLVMTLSLLGGASDLERDLEEGRRKSFYLLMQLQSAALLAMVYTDDLFTAYVFVEVAAITACMAVAAKDTGRAIVSSIRYLVFSCLGSGLLLLGISILYYITGHLLFEPLLQTVAQLWQQGRYTLPLTASALLMALGLSIKSAQFPFHAWLPEAHSNATTAASAVLSGLVLKGYIVLLMKLMLRVFGLELLLSTYMADLFFLLGILGMVAASLSALREEDAKRMVAFSSSAQISYIFLALGLDTRLGLAAACCQLVVHAVTKPMIFVGVGGLIRAAGGAHHWSGLRGAAKRDPLSGLCFTVGGLSLCGLPLLAGFSAKFTIASAALESGWQMIPALLAIAVSSVLNAMYYLPAILAVWSDRGLARLPHAAPRAEGWPYPVAVGCFLLCNLALGIALGPLDWATVMGISLF